jgi:hypothetical protein
MHSYAEGKLRVTGYIGLQKYMVEYFKGHMVTNVTLC